MTYFYSKKSTLNLSTAHVDLQTIFYEIIKHKDCSVLCGYRNEEDQEKEFKEGNSWLHYPKSKHNKKPSMAVDVIPHPVKWDNHESFIRFGEFVKGVAAMLYGKKIITHKLGWGGDWEKFDGPHFYLKN